MRHSICQSSLSSLLKFLNYLQSFVGVFIILYSLWMLNDWNHHAIDKSSAPWFVYTAMSLGVLLCLIAFTGYIAAVAVYGCCLCSYAVFNSVLIVVEAALVGDLVFNEHWEEDLPHDATGNLQSLRAFIVANINFFKWVAVSVVVVQALSLLLAVILRGMVPESRVDDDIEEDFAAMRNPLLGTQGTADNMAIQSDSWSSRMRQKYGLVPAPLSIGALSPLQLYCFNRSIMGYGRLQGSSEPIPSPIQSPPPTKRKCRVILVSSFSILFLLASAISIAFVVQTKARPSGTSLNRTPTQAISKTCGLTRYPALCIDSLVNFPGALNAGERDLVHISLNMTLHRVSRALYDASAIAGVSMDLRARSAYLDCMELLDDSLNQLSQSLLVVAPGPPKQRPRGASDDDVLTWLSAALTNQDTCSEGLDGVQDSYVRQQMGSYLKDLTELVSNSLAIFAISSKNQDFSGIPIQNRRRKLLGIEAEGAGTNFPRWVKRSDRRLLQVPASGIQADMVVSKNENGSYKTIGDAVKDLPQYSNRRIIIYVKAGRYDENIKLGRKITNIMLIGDGKTKTIIAGSRSVQDNYTTFHTATFAATGAGFIMRDMTIENSAGPEKHQAVALRVGADRSVVYRCNIIGYQDTLYVHSQRQFFRECDVYGTVDFIFGNAAVVLQNCSLWARKPMALQKITVTAQNRKDPNQNTGISVHASRVLATAELEAAKSAYPAYLGRPWKLYSRAVYMMSYMGDHIDPAGWLEWNTTFALDTLYYGEYMNYGPGAAVGKRVTWPGYRVITMPEEASKFTVSQFIYGSSWLPSTGVAFLAGLSV